MNMNLKSFFPYFIATVWSNYYNKWIPQTKLPSKGLYIAAIPRHNQEQFRLQTSEVWFRLANKQVQ